MSQKKSYSMSFNPAAPKTVAVPVAPPEAPEPKKGPGRPAKPPRNNPRRLGVTVDDDDYGRILHVCADLRIDRQQFFEQAIALMFQKYS